MSRLWRAVLLLAPLLLPAAKMRHGGGYMYSYYVPPAAGTPWRPAWSPDGKELAFSMAGSIWRLRIGETVAHELTANRTNDSSPAWSPDGRWIAYTAEDAVKGIAHEQGGIGGYVHPWSQDPVRSGYGVARGFAVDLALGSFEYLEVLTRTNHFTNTSKVWHRALNCGFKVTASAGEDSILAMHGTPVLGASRVYVYLGPELSWNRWVDGIRRGRTFVTNGPLLSFNVNGETPGGEIHLPAGGCSVEVTGRFDSIVPVDRMELYMNDEVIETVRAGGRKGELRKRVPVTRSGWLTLRAVSDQPQHPVEDAYVVAETSPVYVYCGNEPIRSREDAEYFLRWVDDVARQAEAHPGWRSERERRHVLDQFAEARRVFEQRAKEAKQ